ncbi:MAG: type IV pilus assembly protein PilM [Meiothermus sp.]|uniref:type IV pilus assembly protein PilM n=1 Tax=Meiothermus sp. TaxID=1955249 RepID=UPI0025E526DE|nr:type IV pilus assembly protein PilM [Meiothermus sp.]MCS7194199.1 type IV pilus assembly protein PilM [Meiothermus sp.]MCX7741170.1 type IV pilus assembly protein PilM [Meiothermus sp.]MDW8090060.1 type IV pilus assembly protein PilM [Meiothermus sp.]MDW8480708.1 type IV pilus assembly protein PilM [Meiothermus sp.]
MRDFFSGLLRPRVEALGLEIGSANIKMVELSGTPPSLKALSIRPTPPGVIREGSVAEPGALADTLKEMLAEMRTRKRYVVTAASNLAVITRTLQVPKMPPKQMEEAVRWEAERYIPFPIDEVVLDYAPLDPPENIPEGEQMDVVVGAARQETIASLVEALKAAGLEPLIIDVKPFAGLRTLESRLRATDREPITLFLEIGAETSALVLTRGERLLLNRVIQLSGKDFTAAIAKAFNLDVMAAEEAKRNYGLATIPTEDEDLLLDFDAERERFNPARMYDAIRPVLVEFTTELRRSLEFFRVQMGDLGVDQGFVAGGGSKLRSLVPLLADTLGIPLEMADPWQDIQIDKSRFDVEHLRSLSAEFAVPVGLALRGVNPLD